MGVREIPEGYELRGHRLKLYPKREQFERLLAMQEEMRRAWNLLVGWRIAHLDACVVRAERDGVIGAAPEKPLVSSREDDSEENRERWRIFLDVSRERRLRGLDHCIGGKVPGYGFMRLGTNAWDYGALRQFVSESSETGKSICSAHQYQALIKNFLKAKRPRPRRKNDPMPLQVMSGVCYRREPPASAVPGRGRLCDATIVFSGMTFRAREPYRRSRAERRPDKGLRYPNAAVLEGVALTRQTDGWYAAVRLVVPVKARMGWSIDDAIGVSFGLDTLCATSSGRVFSNFRRHASTATIALQQRIEATSEEALGSEWKYPDGSRMFLSTSSARAQTRAARRVRQFIEATIIPYLAQYRWIVMAPEGDDELRDMAQGVQTRLTAERGGYVSAMGILRSKIRALGVDRVREVEWVDKAQTCSQCGFVDRNSWRWKPKPHGCCAGCGYVEHRKVNTARNIRSRGLELLKNEEVSFNGCTRPQTS